MTLPMLAVLKKEPPKDKGWLYEKKFDGIRCIAMKKKNKVTLYSRNKKKMNAAYPEIVAVLLAQKNDFVIDGEIVGREKGEESFSVLQKRMHIKKLSKERKKVKVYYFVFDILSFEGKDCKKLSLLDRKKQLKKALHFSSVVRYTAHSMKDPKKALLLAKKNKWEGIIGKRENSRYVRVRSSNWIKLKCVNNQEFIIIGYTRPQRSRKGFGALLIGYYEKGCLKYAGKVGTGYSEEFLISLSSKLKKMEIKNSPVSETIKEKNVHWVSPRLVGEVSFTEWTNDGKLRHPAFLGLRKDKSAKQVTRERAK